MKIQNLIFLKRVQQGFREFLVPKIIVDQGREHSLNSERSISKEIQIVCNKRMPNEGGSSLNKRLSLSFFIVEYHRMSIIECNYG